MVEKTELNKIIEQHQLWINTQKDEQPQGKRADLSQLDLSDQDLIGCNLERARCQHTNFNHAKLAGCNLSHCDLSGANLFAADLQQAKLDFSDLSRADLSSCLLKKANLSHSDLTHADLSGANLSKANLFGAQCIGTDFTDADLSDSDLRRANLAEADVTGVCYDRSARYLGIRIASCFGNPAFKRFAQDQEYLEEFRSRHEYLYLLWWLFTDCGRSILRVAQWGLVFITIFALLYWGLGADAFIIHHGDQMPFGFFTMFYNSVITFTTLGFGDITPNNPLAAALVMMEVLIGYITLGMLIAILANKLARRS